MLGQPDGTYVGPAGAVIKKGGAKVLMLTRVCDITFFGLYLNPKHGPRLHRTASWQEVFGPGMTVTRKGGQKVGPDC